MYKITFIDNTFFINKYAPIDSTWNKIPTKDIVKFEYQLGNILVTMQGYESYNHIVKKGLGINNSLKGIFEVILLGKNKDKVQRIIFDFIHQRVKQDIVNFGEEYNNKSHPGWTPFYNSPINPTYSVSQIKK